MRRRVIDLLILLVVLAVGAVALLNARTIGDWWHGQNYAPEQEISALAEASGMSDTGQNLFYRFEPTLLDQANLTKTCGADKLGCTEGRFIYLLKPSTTAENNQTIVTAAHEMLHVAYSRLSEKQQYELEPLLDAELAKPSAGNVRKSLEGYSAEDYYNEAHSFVGSEIKDISPELESFYAKYFTNRGKTAQAYADSPRD